MFGPKTHKDWWPNVQILLINPNLEENDLVTNKKNYHLNHNFTKHIVLTTKFISYAYISFI